MLFENTRKLKNTFVMTGALCGLMLIAVLSGWGMRNVFLSPNKPNGIAPAQARSTPPIKVISLSVNPKGFSPSKVSVQEGLYLIDINNRTGFSELNLQFGQLSGKKLKESRKIKDSQGRDLKSRDWRGLFNLDSGTYKISEASRPEWFVEIQVEKK